MKIGPLDCRKVCALTSDPLVETATQTSQETYTTALNASCLLNSKMSTDLGAQPKYYLRRPV